MLPMTTLGILLATHAMAMTTRHLHLDATSGGRLHLRFPLLVTIVTIRLLSLARVAM